MYYFLIVLFLLLTGSVISATMAERANPFDRAPIYRNDSFLRLINLLIVPQVVLFIILMIMNWGITLIITPIALILGKYLARISELIIVVPLSKVLFRQ